MLQPRRRPSSSTTSPSNPSAQGNPYDIGLQPSLQFTYPASDGATGFLNEPYGEFPVHHPSSSSLSYNPLPHNHAHFLLPIDFSLQHWDASPAHVNDSAGSLNCTLPYLDYGDTPAAGDTSFFNTPTDITTTSTPSPVPTDPVALSTKHGTASSSSSDTSSRDRVEKRKANTLAARRYRQKRTDRVAELEAALKATQLERDALKMQLAKVQGETQVLKDLVRAGVGGSS